MNTVLFHSTTMACVVFLCSSHYRRLSLRSHPEIVPIVKILVQCNKYAACRPHSSLYSHCGCLSEPLASCNFGFMVLLPPCVPKEINSSLYFEHPNNVFS